MTISVKELREFIKDLKDDDVLDVFGGGSYDCGYGYAPADEIFIKRSDGKELELI